MSRAIALLVTACAVLAQVRHVAAGNRRRRRERRWLEIGVMTLQMVDGRVVVSGWRDA